MADIRPCARKTHKELAAEWDRLAAERHRQIGGGEDLSFEYVLTPTALRLLEGADRSLVLDIGTGTGDFTRRLAEVAGRIISIDPSRASIDVARETCRDKDNVHFVVGALEECVARIASERVTAAVAAMTLMTTPDLERFAAGLSALLVDGGRFVATLVHPWFWPRYWGYEAEEWFDYKREIFVEAPFEISFRHTDIRTTHIHRPLERYIAAFSSVGLSVDSLLEPMPTPDIESLYPKPWLYPRFLALRWRKGG